MSADQGHRDAYQEIAGPDGPPGDIGPPGPAGPGSTKILLPTFEPLGSSLPYFTEGTLADWYVVPGLTAPGGYETLRYRRVDNTLYFRGSCNADRETDILTLPVGFQPLYAGANLDSGTLAAIFPAFATDSLIPCHLSIVAGGQNGQVRRTYGPAGVQHIAGWEAITFPCMDPAKTPSWEDHATSPLQPTPIAGTGGSDGYDPSGPAARLPLVTS